MYHETMHIPVPHTGQGLGILKKTSEDMNFLFAHEEKPDSIFIARKEDFVAASKHVFLKD